MASVMFKSSIVGHTSTYIKRFHNIFTGTVYSHLYMVPSILFCSTMSNITNVTSQGAGENPTAYDV